jgi:two-component system sensor histidine kinase ChvG
VLARIAQEQKLRLRLYDIEGKLTLDTFVIAEPSFAFVDPATEPWYQDAARSLDNGMNFLLGTATIPSYRDPSPDEASAWPELVKARQIDGTATARC